MKDSVYSKFGGAELLQIAEAVSREKNMPRDVFLEAMEQAIQVAGRRKYGQEHEIRASIDRKTGNVNLCRVMTVVANVEDPATQISVDQAQFRFEGAKEGDVLEDQLPPIDFGRIAAQTAKQVIIQKVRDAERDRQFDEFKDRIDEVINGTVKRVEHGNTIVEIGRTEAVLTRDESIPREAFRVGDRIRALLLDVRRERSGPQIFLSRSHPKFLAKLFAQEVPEIYDGIIEIKSVARDPGSRAKIAVASRDGNIDPVGSCVGIRGVRVQAVTNELQGEKIDIIQWSSDPAAVVVNALAPAEVAKVVIDETNNKLEVVVPDDQLSLAIGRRGQNVKLASQLIGVDIDVLTEDEESKRRSEEFNRLSKTFTEALNVEDVIAQLLVAEGFSKVEEVAFAAIDELASIEGFDEAIAAELINRAKTHLDSLKEKLEKSIKKLGVSKEVLAIDGITMEIGVLLGENNIKSLDDLGDLSRDEFIEIVPNSGLSDKQIDDIIMKARENWFSDDDNHSKKVTG